MISLDKIPDLRSRIAMYLHGRVIDDQGRALLDEAADALCWADGLLKHWQRRVTSAEALRATEVDDGK